jgi:glutaredoxin
MGTYEWENCPYCKKRISDVRIGLASATTIGPEHAKCPHCGGVFKTDKSEWAKKSTFRKAGYFMRVVWWCIGAAILGGGGGFIAVLVIMGMVLKAPYDQIFSVGLIIAVVVGILAVAKVIYSSRREIKESLEKAGAPNKSLKGDAAKNRRAP